MEILSNPFHGGLKRYWRRRGYKRLHGITHRKNMKTVRFGGSPQRAWRIRATPKLRLKIIILSPLKLWRKLKNAYVSMMLNLAGNVGHLNNGNVLVEKRIPKDRQPHTSYSTTEFDNRLVLEIYKSFVASRELAST